MRREKTAENLWFSNDFFTPHRISSFEGKKVKTAENLRFSTSHINLLSRKGQYIIYMNGKIAAYLCDDRLLVKPVPSAVRMIPNAAFEPPYEGAKEMILVDNVDNKAFLKELFEAMFDELPEPKKRKK